MLLKHLLGFNQAYSLRLLYSLVLLSIHSEYSLKFIMTMDHVIMNFTGFFSK